MSNNQDIQDEGGAWKYFAPMLHIDDDDLDAYQYRLLGHYRRVCGANRGKCTESTKTTATVTKMSTGKVSAVRKQLAELGRINLDIKRAGTTITLRDCWRENILRYSQPSPDENPVERSPHEQGVHHMNDSVHHMKQRTTVNNQETKETLASPHGNAAGDAKTTELPIGWQLAIDQMILFPDAPFYLDQKRARYYLGELVDIGKISTSDDWDEVLPTVKQALIAPPTTTPQLLPDNPTTHHMQCTACGYTWDKLGDPVQGNVACPQCEIFGTNYREIETPPTPPAPEKPKKERQPNLIFDAVAVGSFGLENVNGDKTAGGRIGKIAAWLKKQPGEVTPEMVMEFYGWYDRVTKNCDRPRDVGKFAEHWLKWIAEGSKTMTTPQPIEDDIEWVLPSTRPVVQYADKPE